MRWPLLWVLVAVFLATELPSPAYRAIDEADIYLAGPALNVAGLKFTIPAKWIAEPSETASRVGQWRVPPARGQTGEDGEAVLFSFGPGNGGDAKTNIEAWIGTMANAEGHPAAAEVKHREIGKIKISQVVIFGTYNQAVPLPGIPPQMRMNYGLIGIVMETPQGNLFWRLTGPEALVTASLPLLSKIADTAKPLDQ